MDLRTLLLLIVIGVLVGYAVYANPQLAGPITVAVAVVGLLAYFLKDDE